MRRVCQQKISVVIKMVIKVINCGSGKNPESLDFTGNFGIFAVAEGRFELLPKTLKALNIQRFSVLLLITFDYLVRNCLINLFYPFAIFFNIIVVILLRSQYILMPHLPDHNRFVHTI